MKVLGCHPNDVCPGQSSVALGMTPVTPLLREKEHPRGLCGGQQGTTVCEAVLQTTHSMDPPHAKAKCSPFLHKLPTTNCCTVLQPIAACHTRHACARRRQLVLRAGALV